MVPNDDPDFPLDSSRIDRMVSAISSISAERTIDQPAALSEYGLSDPICQVTVDTGSGEQSVLSFGNEAELGGSRYMSIGDGKVTLSTRTSSTALTALFMISSPRSCCRT